MSVSLTEQEDAAAAIAERLSDPRVAQALASLMDNADLLAVLVEGLDGFIRRGDTITESVVAGLHEVRDASGAGAAIDVSGLLSSARQLAAVLPQAGPVLARTVESGAFETLLSSDVMSPQAVHQVEVFARGLTRGSRTHATTPVPVTGLLSLGRLLKDPDINRAMSYFATVAKAIGQELAEDTK